jgi:hypothetical protein
MQAYSMPFSKVIDIDAGAREHFHVPKYQREYAWAVKSGNNSCRTSMKTTLVILWDCLFV